MLLIILSILSVLFFLAWLAWVNIKDRRYLKKKTSEVFSDDLKKEIEEEKADFIKRQTAFTRVLQRVSSKKKTP